MKPDWKYAPDWANWLMQDADGTWWWTERRPPELDVHDESWGTGGGGYDKAEAVYLPTWQDSLERRP